jgi:hypothetical protein
VIILLAYAVFCIALARHDALAIYKGKAISHDRNGMLHGIFCAVMLFACLFTHAWLLLACMPFIGRVVFDISLNKFRGKEWNYVSPWLLSKSPAIRARVSVMDRMEYAVFKSAVWPKVVYVVVIVLLIVMHFSHVV